MRNWRAEGRRRETFCILRPSYTFMLPREGQTRTKSLFLVAVGTPWEYILRSHLLELSCSFTCYLWVFLNYPWGRRWRVVNNQSSTQSFHRKEGGRETKSPNKESSEFNNWDYPMARDKGFCYHWARFLYLSETINLQPEECNLKTP